MRERDDRAAKILERLGLTASDPLAKTFLAPLDARSDIENGSLVVSENPANGRPLAAVRLMGKDDYERAAEKAHEAFKQWRTVPAPVRGEIVRRMGNAFRDHKDDLGALVTLEMGKILPEGKGEVQECIDIADFAVGLSRQLYGLTIASERPSHRMFEQWHPLGVVGVITAFNFPVAVWAWNAMLAAVCGDAVMWKPSLATPLTALAMTKIAHDTMREQDLWKPTGGVDPTDLFPLVIGTDNEVGETMTADKRLPLISATGSCRMGRHVAQRVAARLGRTLLELGGNNAIILMPDADMELAKRAVVFGAVGTCGQRCTSTRRLICVGGSEKKILDALKQAYTQVPIGDPMDGGTLVGPLINAGSVEQMKSAVRAAVEQGCEVLVGGVDAIEEYDNNPGNYVAPTIVRVPKGKVPQITKDETFAPILYVFTVDSIEEAIDLQNGVDQGLSSAIFSDSFRSVERFLSPEGSDCGIANANIGTSGAEIGGAFGGEKDTGGGRESGSDSWKVYMRRQTCTVNYGTDLPLAQGIQFG
ncbi:MAG: L-piperidine-6-carboxylate dehydrogenase [Phycisphaerales bacterium]